MIWAASVYHWPPSVTREQSLRDLKLLYDARDAMED